MKRFLVFGGDYYDRGWGWDDFIVDLEDKEEAIKKARSIIDDEIEWSQVCDTQTKTVIFSVWPHYSTHDMKWDDYE